MKLLVTILGLSAMLYAQDKLSNGNGVGNGGDAIVCKDKVELLDFVESKLMKKYSILPNTKDLDYKVLAEQKIEKLKSLDKRLYEQYGRVLSKLKSRLVFIENAQFRDVPDSFQIAIPQGCKLEQLAIQQEVEGQTKIHISKSLWEKMDNLNKAGLILHEILYEHLLMTGEVNSIKARKLNSLLFSEDIDRMSRAKFKQELRNLGLKMY